MVALTPVVADIALIASRKPRKSVLSSMVTFPVPVPLIEKLITEPFAKFGASPAVAVLLFIEIFILVTAVAETPVEASSALTSAANSFADCEVVPSIEAVPLEPVTV